MDLKCAEYISDDAAQQRLMCSRGAVNAPKAQNSDRGSKIRETGRRAELGLTALRLNLPIRLTEGNGGNGEGIAHGTHGIPVLFL